mmetsp:Transcript_27709/g.52004  ORF Transcript_27709/g.52004 Transcript_27709/m.52004 type:complete len:106 (-) Transcript_27709:242-559(-)
MTQRHPHARETREARMNRRNSSGSTGGSSAAGRTSDNTSRRSTSTNGVSTTTTAAGSHATDASSLNSSVNDKVVIARQNAMIAKYRDSTSQAKQICTGPVRRVPC